MLISSNCIMKAFPYSSQIMTLKVVYTFPNLFISSNGIVFFQCNRLIILRSILTHFFLISLKYNQLPNFAVSSCSGWNPVFLNLTICSRPCFPVKCIWEPLDLRDQRKESQVHSLPPLQRAGLFLVMSGFFVYVFYVCAIC